MTSQKLVAETANVPMLVSIGFDATAESIYAAGQTGQLFQYSTHDGSQKDQQTSTQRAYGEIAGLPSTDAWHTTTLGGQMLIMSAEGREQRLMWTHANSFGHVACAPTDPSP
ncbi:MAG: hypothetical protein P8J37_04995 [Fuerstiella sp.]|nr:hypothetical protein [Fuerstiella sp.]